MFSFTEPRHYVNPSIFELTTDINDEDVAGPIAERLQVIYLSQVTQFIDYPTTIDGILYSSYYRPFISLQVASQTHNLYLNVIFLIVPCSPCLYVCSDVVRHLGYTDTLPETFNLLFNSKTHEAVTSPSNTHFYDLNLLGASFLSKERANLIMNYANNTISLSLE